MSQSIEVVEGQALARGVLEALDQGATPDWPAFDLAYREPLLRMAASRSRRLDLHRQFTPEDVLHAFLLNRVFPTRQARKMFGPTACGRRPLRPRLLASLANYCVDLTRDVGGGRSWGEYEDMLANTPAPAKAPLPTFEEVKDLLRRQMAAIRDAYPLRRRPHGAAYREALLLRLRLDWAGGFDGVELRALVDGGSVVLTLPLLEECTAWTTEEGSMTLAEGGVPLEPLWRQVRAILTADQNRQAAVDQFVALIPVSRDGWHQWISRGWRRLQMRLGPEYGRIFALWGGQGGGV